tara:strand:- start:248 stop:706 length:459 start_codon:yes stop_codon:yes gene_type:complete
MAEHGFWDGMYFPEPKYGKDGITFHEVPTEQFSSKYPPARVRVAIDLDKPTEKIPGLEGEVEIADTELFEVLYLGGDFRRYGRFNRILSDEEVEIFRSGEGPICLLLNCESSVVWMDKGMKDLDEETKIEHDMIVAGIQDRIKKLLKKQKGT